MYRYSKPIIITHEDFFEGVYLSSGDDACYKCKCYIHQRPETGRNDYRIQVDAVHNSDGHHSSEQILTIGFNVPVKYVSSNGTLMGGDGSNTLKILYKYHNNAVENIGLGDVVVEANADLAITSCILDCNYSCPQH